MKRFAVIHDDHDRGYVVVEWAANRREAEQKAVAFAKANTEDDADVFVAEMLGKLNLNPNFLPVS